MPIDFGNAVRAGFSFAWSARRISLFFFYYGLFLALFLFPLIFLVLPFLGRLVFVQGAAFQEVFSPSFLNAFAGVLGAFLVLFILLILFLLAGILLNGAFIDSAKNFFQKKKSSSLQSLGVASKKFFSLFFAAIIVAVMVLVVSMILSAFAALPLIGGVFSVLNVLASILLAVAFLFVPYQIMIGNKSAVESISSSARLFQENALELLLLWILVIAFPLLIVLAAAVPIGFSIAVVVLAPYSLASEAVFIASLCIFVAGVCLAQLVSIGTLASAFLQLTAKRAARKNR